MKTTTPETIKRLMETDPTLEVSLGECGNQAILATLEGNYKVESNTPSSNLLISYLLQGLLQWNSKNSNYNPYSRLSFELMMEDYLTHRTLHPEIYGDDLSLKNPAV